MKKTKSTKKRTFQELFLENFVEALIVNTQIEHQGLTTKQEIQKDFSKPLTEMETSPMTVTAFQVPETQQVHSQDRLQTAVQKYERPKVSQPIRQPQFPIPQGSPIQKIFPFLQDPGVTSIECSGPGRNIILNKQGIIQATPTTLDQNEINAIINDISAKTKIPLVEGVFKAAMGNIHITAVISEFVGTRFILEKRRRQPQPGTLRYR